MGDVNVENEQNENDADGSEIQLGNNANDDPPNNLQRVLQQHRSQSQQHEEDLISIQQQFKNHFQPGGQLIILTIVIMIMLS